MKQYLDKLGVAGRIMAMPAVAIVCMAILFGVAYTGFAKLNGTVDNLYNQRFANHKASATLLAETTQLHANLYKLLSWINAGYDKAQIDPFVAEQKGALPNIENRIAGLLGSEKLGDQERRQLLAAAAHLKDYATATADMLDVAETDTTYAAVLMGTTDDKFQQLKKTLDELSALEDALGKEGYLSAEQDSTTGIRNSLLVAAIALLISGLLAFVVTRSVKRPLSAMQEAIVLIGGSRDLTIRVPVTSSDELGNMGRHLNATLGQVADSMRTVVTVADRVADHAEHLAGATVRLTESSHAQAATAAEMAAAVEQITVSIGSVAEHAAETEALTGQASAHVTQGATVVEEVSRQMSLNAEQMTESSSHIARLAEQSRQVGGIVQVIRDIADQTNLLALNAAIEAARAGETGRGFAVVADEVRKLAERTATATAEIGQLIENIQHDVATVVDSIDTSTRLADKSASLAAEAGRVFTEISGSASQAADRVHDIAVAAREQSSAGQGIAGNVEKVARMTEENSAATESIASAATQLKQQAAHLDEAVSRFRV